MKHVKKWVSLILAALLLLSVCGMTASAKAVSRPERAHLSFNDDGKLTILQVADLQNDENLDEAPRKLLCAAVEQIKPDLIMLTGDNIAGYLCPTKEEAQTAIRAFMDIFESYAIPVAAVFGNHDDDSTALTKDEQIDIYESYSCFIGCRGVVAEKTVEGRTTKNVGTYNIPVFESKTSDKVMYNIWCFDSGNRNPDPAYGGYGYVLPEQVEWYENTSRALQAANGGELVQSIAFQHIAPPHIYKALKKVPVYVPGAVKYGGQYYVLPRGVNRLQNWMSESPCPPETNFADGYLQLDAMIARGDVRAVFYGHDHVNHYVVPYEGIDLVSSAGCTYQSYNDLHRGFRVITIDKSDVHTYSSTHVSAVKLLKWDWLRLTSKALAELVWSWIKAHVFRVNG